jgi:hypothetical protein
MLRDNVNIMLRGNLARDLADTTAPFGNAGYSLLQISSGFSG